MAFTAAIRRLGQPLWEIGCRVMKALYHAKFSTPAHSLLFLPTALDSTARTVLVGFSNGVVRGLMQCLEAWKVTSTFKPHSGRL